MRLWAVLLLVLLSTASARAEPEFQETKYRDGHSRPRALVFNPDDGLIYVALSTADEVAVVDPAPTGPRLIERIAACRFPDALAPLPGGGALVGCRFDRGLRRIARDPGGRWRTNAIGAGPAAGARGLAIAPGGKLAYVASPAIGGVKVVSLSGGGVVQTVTTGNSPRAMRLAPAGGVPGHAGPMLLVSNFIDHTVTVHAIDAGGRLGNRLQTIRTEAPVLDMLVVSPARPDDPPALLLFTHEDRPLSRANGPVEGLDSGILRIPAAAARGESAAPFDDPGPGRRVFLNLGERRQPVIELAAAVEAAGELAVVGAGSDNLLVFGAVRAVTPVTIDVGTNPTAVAALPGGRFVTADRLGDTLTFVGGAPRAVLATLKVGVAERSSPAERGELLFYSRALVPNNVADGAFSLYTCAACHDDGQTDGRRHPAKRNRFFSMTRSCQGLGTTAPYLSLGEPETIAAFADNIVATHAQGAERDPEKFDRYPVTLRLHSAGGGSDVVLSPEEVREALAQYMTIIPPEPSPFSARDRAAFSPLERRGLALFKDSCTGCHLLVGNSALGNVVPRAELERRLLANQVALTSPRRHDVGTPVLGDGGNNPPSLRGVWNAAPYFSDGSARTLEQLLRRTNPDAKHVHGPENATRPPAFSAGERDALLAFLRAL
jgi:hypothetical protein